MRGILAEERRTNDLQHVKEHVANGITGVHVHRDCTKLVFVHMEDCYVFREARVDRRRESKCKENNHKAAWTAIAYYVL